MPDTATLITQAYAAFNRRDIDTALRLMTEHVRWPKASEGGDVVGKDEIRAYWTRQWNQFDPHVEPLQILTLLEGENGKARVKVHQVVKNLAGDLLSDSELWHTYTFAEGLIARMELPAEQEGATAAPSAAFSHPEKS